MGAIRNMHFPGGAKVGYYSACKLCSSKSANKICYLTAVSKYGIGSFNRIIIMFG
jgi:hypothetical protein